MNSTSNQSNHETDQESGHTLRLRHNDVRIIVPVYKNESVTRRCLESLGKYPLPANSSVTVIVDGSPEQGVIDYCEAECAAKGYDVIVNTQNQGFVRTANQGFALDSTCDVVLLNSDTVVAGNWLERLQDCAYSDPKAGTVTPFSNNGTICSYPIFPQENALPEDWDTASLDELFARVNAGKSHPIPTAVGFCMYIKRQCLNETGEFDPENFGQGYGEECDFSLRATKLGWSHLLCADVFVFHEGGASFSTETKDRKRHADGVMAKLHPSYDELITGFILEDPAYPLRDAVTRARIVARPQDITAVIQEQAAFRESLRQEIASEQHKTGLVRSEVKLVQIEREKLEGLLAASRSEYEKTQAALDNAHETLDSAHEALDTLSTNFGNLQTEASELLQQVDTLARQLDETGAQLHASQDTNKALSARLEQILGSRSWRYTRWMRRDD